MLIKVMIVDDESLIRVGVQKIIELESSDFHISALSSNGKEALEIFKKDQAEIVITDVSMPLMNGLDLIEEIKKINTNTEFIVLSGYDQFSYAKRGIALGVSNYILKPISEEELMATMSDIRCKIIEKQGKNEGKLDFSIIKESLVEKILKGNVNAFEKTELEKGIGLDLNLKFFSVTVISIERIQEKNDDNLEGMLEHLKKYNNHKRLFIKDKESNLICICGSDMIFEMERKQSLFLRRLVNEIRVSFKVNLYITTGKPQAGYSKIFKGYDSAKELQKFLLVDGYNNKIDGERNASQKVISSEKKLELKEFRKILIIKNKDELEEYLQNQFEGIKLLYNDEPQIIREIVIRMVVTIEEVYEEFNIESCLRLKNIINEVYEIKTIQDMRTKVNELSENLIDKLKDNFKNKSPIINRILKFIDKEYSNDISLKILGGKFNINPTYLGQLFFKEVGCGFSDYLNRVKNEKAKELILNTDMKINEVAKIMGYSDTSYFYRKFKAYHGISPKTLRKNKKY